MTKGVDLNTNSNPVSFAIEAIDYQINADNSFKEVISIIEYLELTPTKKIYESQTLSLFYGFHAEQRSENCIEK
jgi:hypothetical protein